MAEDEVYFDDADEIDIPDDLEDIDVEGDVEEEETDSDNDLSDSEESEIEDDISIMKIIDIKPIKTKLNDINKSISKYEMTRLLGFRAQQISEGAELYIEIPSGIIDPLELAIIEYNKGKLPYLLVREYCNEKPGETFETIHTLDSLIRFNPLY